MNEWAIMTYAFPAAFAGLFYLRTACCAVEGVENAMKTLAKKEKARKRRRDEQEMEAASIATAAVDDSAAVVQDAAGAAPSDIPVLEEVAATT